jgi:hypothetical protein
VVSLVHVENEAGEHNVINYRVYKKNTDGKTKNQHFRDMVLQAKERGIKARKILFDAWYSSAENLKWVHRLGMVFVTALKSNRQVSTSKEAGYIKITDLVWDEESLEKGMSVKLKEVPFKVRLLTLIPILRLSEPFYGSLKRHAMRVRTSTKLVISEVFADRRI